MNSGQKVYFQVVEYIKELVKTGQVEVGGRLPSERELMERLGLSRNSIREALRTLENMGIIESRQGKGNYLANNMGRSLSGVFSTLLLMKETSYLEVSQLRHAMEMQAFYMAADQIGPGEKQEFEEIIGRMRHPVTGCHGCALGGLPGGDRHDAGGLRQGRRGKMAEAS